MAQYKTLSVPSSLGKTINIYAKQHDMFVYEVVELAFQKLTADQKPKVDKRQKPYDRSTRV